MILRNVVGISMTIYKYVMISGGYVFVYTLELHFSSETFIQEKYRK